MGCFPFANFHFQMGVTVMGFAEHLGIICNSDFETVGPMHERVGLQVCCVNHEMHTDYKKEQNQSKLKS